MPEEVYASIKDSDLILHAGDITSIEFLEKLKKIAEVKVVSGNMDDHEIKENLPRKQLLRIGGFSIALIHGWGAPKAIVDLVYNEFLQEKPDIIIFGHSHQPFKKQRNGTLLFNPGSPTDKIFASVNSYGIITLDEQINAQIIKLNG